MSYLTYRSRSESDKPLVWLRGEVKTPPFSVEARVETGYLLRLPQRGERLSMPHSGPMPAVGPRCHELRIDDRGSTFRLIYRTDPDAAVIAEVFKKTTRRTPPKVLEVCRRRLREYERLVERDG